ncbi:hypothetical protein [Methylomonas rhizoryzae]|uniref:hypothetical protein n=1 Tax=Methylomonas rhizoryzae TaxID=2608981 RepID=UPI0012329362|nr:hypothetical protein [Methylomonas rhizoryzae]
MQTKQSKVLSKQPGRSLSPESQEQRKRKTQDIKREIRQEWDDTEHAHRTGSPVNSNCFWRLSQMAAAAGRDYRKNGHRYSQGKTNFVFYWRTKNAEPIKVSYFLSRHGAVVLTPPKNCPLTREAMGI